MVAIAFTSHPITAWASCSNELKKVEAVCVNNQVINQCKDDNQVPELMALAKKDELDMQARESVTKIDSTVKDCKSRLPAEQQKCTDAGKSCFETCQSEHQGDPSMQRAMTKACQDNHDDGQKKFQAANNEFSSMLQQLLPILQALMGMFGKKDKEQELADLKKDEEEDICKSEYAPMLVECGGVDPNTSKRSAGLNRTGVLSGSTVGVGSGLGEIGQATNGGVQSSGKKSSPIGAASGAGGLGGALGFSGSGSSGGSDSGKVEKASADIGKGYLGGGGGGGGFGSFGGGGSKGGASFSGAFNPNGGKGAGAGAKLKKAMGSVGRKKGGRGLASTDGKGGPFQDNWNTISKAYKSNSATLYHQE